MDLHDLPPEKRPRAIERFHARVPAGTPDGCWEWIGSRASRYGIFSPKRCTNAGAHRVAWEIANGRPIPDGLFVLHRCDNPPCVNPAHLFLGTPGDNMRDMAAKGRVRYVPAPGEANSRAKLTDEAVREIRRAVRGTFSALARRFGVSSSLVSRIAKRKAWRHVT